MSEPRIADNRGSGLLLCVYTVMAAIFAYVAYLLGRSVEASFGSQVSMLFFVGTFVGALVLSFPLAYLLTSRIGAGPTANEPPAGV